MSRQTEGPLLTVSRGHNYKLITHKQVAIYPKWYKIETNLQQKSNRKWNITVTNYIHHQCFRHLAACPVMDVAVPTSVT